MRKRQGLIIMANTITTKFKKVWKSEILKRLKLRNELDSEINKLDSERDKLDSEINKLDSEILMIFYNFGKENECQVMWRAYDFKEEEIELKTYNKDKTGFIFYKLDGSQREELFEKKPEETKVIDGHTYKLVK